MRVILKYAMTTDRDGARIGALMRNAEEPVLLSFALRDSFLKKLSYQSPSHESLCGSRLRMFNFKGRTRMQALAGTKPYGGHAMRLVRAQARWTRNVRIA